MLRSVPVLFYLTIFLVSGCTPVCSYAETIAVAPDEQANNTAPRQSPDRSDAGNFNRAYFKGYITDFTGIITSPARWDSSDWFTATTAVGIIAGLYDNDAKIQKWVLQHRTNTTNDIGNTITYIGHGKFTIPLLGGMYLYGHVADSVKMRKTVLLSAESFVLTGIFVQALKYSTGRHRPYTDDPPHTWDGPRLHNTGSRMSFPSGHASSAFAVATVIATEYGSVAVATLSYTVATITALNRVAHNAHWLSDVVAGSAIGYFTGKAIVASHSEGSRMGLAPLIEGDTQGLLVTYRY